MIALTKYLRSEFAQAIFVFALIAVVHLGALGVVTHALHSHAETLEQYIDRSGDEAGYVALAREMLSQGTFNNISSGLPETFRTPGYPAFVASILALSGNSITVLLVLQAFLPALVALLVFRVCRALSLPTTLSISMAIFSGLSPSVIELVLAGWGSDLLYTSLLLFATFIAFKVPSAKQPYLGAAIVGIILGTATLVRPVGLYIAPIIFVGLACLALTASLSRKKSIALGVVALVAFGALLLPWYVRNKIETNHFFLSSLPAYNFVSYNIPDFLAHENGTTHSVEMAKILTSLGNPSLTDLGSYTMTDTLTAYGAAFLRNNLIPYIPFHILSTIPFFVGSGLRDDVMIVQGMGLVVPFTPNNDNLTSLLLHGHFRTIAVHLVEYWPFALESLTWAILFMLAFIAPFLSSDRRARVFLVLGVVLILASAMLTGPVARPRYRVPIEPYVWVGAAYATWQIWRRVQISRKTLLFP